MGTIKKGKPSGMEEIMKAMKPTLPPSKRYIRTTFNLTQEAHDCIKKTARLWSEKNADVIAKAISLYCSKGMKKETLEEMLKPHVAENKRIRKTYIVEKDSLSKLINFSQENDIPRDLILEAHFHIFKKLIDGQDLSTKRVYEEVLEGGYEDVELGIDSSLQGLKEAADCMKEELDAGDPMLSRLSKIITELSGLVGDMRTYIAEEQSVKGG